MASKEIAIKVENITKSFKIPTEASNGIKQKIINVLKGVRGYREFTPLKDISLEINKGDFFGIVGRNGSGKSTLLKTIAGIYTPTEGSVQVNGTLVPFIELGVGFNPELSGRENVFLNGALLGFDHKEMEAMYDEIVEFAELREFMDEKLKNYSSGMQVRLAFSIAIKAEGDILLLDEVLAVGDTNFQRKCFEYFRQLKDKKKTIILVTHDMTAVERFCNKAMIVDKSEVIGYGSPLEITKAYNKLNTEMADRQLHQGKERERSARVNSIVNVRSVETLSSKMNKQNVFQPHENITIRSTIAFSKSIEDISVIIKIAPKGGTPIINISSRMLGYTVSGEVGQSVELLWSTKNILNNGSYSISVQVMSGDRVTVLDDLVEGCVFESLGWKYPFSTIHPEISVKRGR